MTGWQKEHERALANPRPVEAPHVHMYRAVQAAVAFGWHEDGYADTYVIDLCTAARGLLSMDSGRLDCGTLDAYYAQVIRQCGGEP